MSKIRDEAREFLRQCDDWRDVSAIDGAVQARRVLILEEALSEVHDKALLGAKNGRKLDWLLVDITGAALKAAEEVG